MIEFTHGYYLDVTGYLDLMVRHVRKYLEELTYTLLHRDGRLEAQLTELGVRDLVVPLVLVLSVGRRRDLALGDEFLDGVGDLPLGHIHGLVTDVVCLATHLLVLVDGQDEGPGSVLHMQESPPE